MNRDMWEEMLAIVVMYIITIVTLIGIPLGFIYLILLLVKQMFFS